MIFKKILILFSILILFLSILLPFQLSNAEESDKKILLVYDRRNYFGDKQDAVTAYRELFGHFNVTILEESEKDYVKGQADNYDYIFILGVEGKFTNLDLIEDLKKTRKTVCWIGEGIQKFLDDNENISLVYSGRSDNLVKIFYDNQSFDIGTINDFIIVDNLSQNTKVYSWLSDGNKQYPYILKENNFWYVSRLDASFILFYIFADILYDIFDEYNIEKSQVFIRVEGVHPFRDLKKLRKIGEYLNSKDIPFMIALIPAYKSPDSSYVTPMSEKPEFVETIKYMQELGGSIILHGYTHQSFGGELSGEGYEFWDGINDKPLDLDIEKWTYERVGLGLKECVENGIYPLAFEAPHYAVSQEGYGELKKYFSTYFGHIQTSNQGFTTTSYPYKLYDTKLFHKLVPENLGYIDPDNPFPINEIMNNLREVSIVRGFTAGVFFHPYLDIEYLKEIVESIEDRNIEFYDLKKENNWVRWEDISIISENGKIVVADLETVENDPIKETSALGIKILIILVLIINTIFFTIFMKSKKRANKILLGD